MRRLFSLFKTPPSAPFKANMLPAFALCVAMKNADMPFFPFIEAMKDGVAPHDKHDYTPPTPGA